MNREAPFVARIAFRRPHTLYDKLALSADKEDRPLANLICTIVKQAVTETMNVNRKLPLCRSR